jgi:DNA-binding MarR family transcriptional regulator
MIISWNTRSVNENQTRRAPSVSFLLAQVGAAAARRFAKQLEPLGFTPPEAGILRLLSRSPGISQQELATRLEVHASRLVAIIDSLEKRGLVAREANPEDRRVYRLNLTGIGGEALAAIGKVAREHDEWTCEGFTLTEREHLAEMLGRLAQRQGLQPEIHPGYRTLHENRTNPERS